MSQGLQRFKVVVPSLIVVGFLLYQLWPLITSNTQGDIAVSHAEMQQLLHEYQASLTSKQQEIQSLREQGKPVSNYHQSREVFWQERVAFAEKRLQNIEKLSLQQGLSRASRLSMLGIFALFSLIALLRFLFFPLRNHYFREFSPLASAAVATQRDDISWQPLRRGGVNVATHYLRCHSPRKLVLRPGYTVTLLAWVFLALGLKTLIISIYHSRLLEAGNWWEGFIPGGALWLFAGGLIMALYAQKTVFVPVRDMAVKGVSWMPFSWTSIPLGQVQAIQIIDKRVHSSKNRYGFRSQEMNLVFENGERLNILDHGDEALLQEQAAMLADFLAIPVWLRS